MAKKALTLQELRHISTREKELARGRIQVGAIIGRLQGSVIGESIELTPTQVKAASLLLQVAGMITTKVESETTVKHEHSITAETIKLLRMANTKIIELDDSKQSLTIEHKPAEPLPVQDVAVIPVTTPAIVSTHSQNEEEEYVYDSKW